MTQLLKFQNSGQHNQRKQKIAFWRQIRAGYINTERRMFQKKSIKRSLILWFLFIGIVPMALSIAFLYIQKNNLLKNNAYDKLLSIRDLKVELINNWLLQTESDTRTLTENNRFENLGSLFRDEFDINETRLAYAEIKNILKDFLELNPIYSDAFIINPISGKVAVSANFYWFGNDLSTDVLYSEPIKTGKYFIKDIHLNENSEEINMAFAMPIFEDEYLYAGKHVAGVLVTIANLDNTIFPLLEDRKGLGKSGESYIVNSDGVALSNLKNIPNAALNYRFGTSASVKAVSGESGITEQEDYSGNKVLAAYAPISSVNWGFIVKQDVSELFPDVKQMYLPYAISFLVLLIVIVIIAILVSRSILNPVRKITRVSEAIENGNFSARITGIPMNEFGKLSKSFNRMAMEISSNFEVWENVMDISKTIMGISVAKEFGEKLLQKLIWITKANIGLFHIYNNEEGQFDPFVSVGAEEDILISYPLSNILGEFGDVVSSDRIAFIKRVDSSTKYKFATTAGLIPPKEIICLPITYEDKVIGIISLVNIHPFPENTLDTLDHSRLNINYLYSTIIANEKSDNLSDNLSVVNKQLEVQTQELIHKKEELQKYTLELNEQNKELNKQRQHVEEANRLKSEFVSNMSHELRTPLNSILALSSVLIMKSKDRLTSEEQEYLKIVERNGKQLLSLINDILDLSKIEAGKIELNTGRVSLVSLLNTILDNIRPLAVKKGLDLNLKVSGEIPVVESNEHKLTQVFQNIIGNSIKFTNEGGVNIKVELTKEDQVSVTVYDTGIGIPEKDLPHIFEEFRQVDGTTSRKYEGTGLGLAIAKKTIELLGGTITAKSQLGIGSTFIITLPVEAQHDSKPKQVTYYKPGNKQHGNKEILIVDDDQSIASTINGYLVDEGYDTLIATSGAEALMLAEKFQPAVITLDIVMPEMDGWEVLQELKKNPKTKNIPVIVVSVSEDLKTGLALGAIGHLRKPIIKDVLLNKVDSIFRTFSSLLLVDDNDLDLQLMSYKLKSEKWNVNTASGGKDALVQIDQDVPDLLILDLLMPEVDGFQVLEQIRNQEKTKDLPVIIITAKNLTEEDQKKLNGKVSKVLVKSQTSLHELHGEINTILGDMAQMAEQEEQTIEKVKQKLLLIKNSGDNVENIIAALSNEDIDLMVVEGIGGAILETKDSVPDGIILNLGVVLKEDMRILYNLQRIKELDDIPTLIITSNELNENSFPQGSTKYIQYLTNAGIKTNELLHKIKSLTSGEGADEEQAGINPEPKRVAASSYVQPTPDPFMDLDEPVRQRNFEKEREEKVVNYFSKDSSFDSENNSLEKPVGRKKVLIIEDNDDSRVAVNAILKDSYDIVNSSDGIDGLNKAKFDKPDIILLDISLPLMDGLEVVRILKSNDDTSHIPVIAVTANAMKNDRENCLANGCNEYVTKPVDPEELQEKMLKALS